MANIIGVFLILLAIRIIIPGSAIASALLDDPDQ